MKTTLCLEVEFDPAITDAESVSSALDALLENALSTPGILDEQGNPTFGRASVLEKEDKHAAVVERLADKAQAAGLEPEDLDESVHDLASSVAADVNNGGLEEQIRYLVEGLGTQHAERQIDELVEGQPREEE
jgi:hypothetical protein